MQYIRTAILTLSVLLFSACNTPDASQQNADSDHGHAHAAAEETPAPPSTTPPILITNVRIFDGVGNSLSAASNVFIVGNTIARISTDIIEAEGAQVIDGEGRTLMPGLIDAHTHIMFSTLPQLAILTSDIGFVNLAAGKAASDMLLRGFTSVRDLGGPIFGLKKAIDMGLVDGPRIWPSGAFISQSGGHGDFRLPNEIPARPGDVSYGEKVNAAAIADDPSSVRKRSREQLMLGASQLKLMAGGGVSSVYDPIDVTQYTVEEIRAAVEAAENWGTYVTVHAYTPRAVQQSIEAGVKCIDHGQMLDEATARLMAQKGIWWSLQPFIEDGHSPFADGTPNRIKQQKMYAGTDHAYALAKKHNIKTAWGTDILFSAENAQRQNEKLTLMTRWYTPAEVLRMATSVNAELLALSGERSPYAGRLGVVQEGALADLLLVNGDPTAQIELLNDPATNLILIMKDGRVVKDIR
jgi:imidazolonepropionase-like amidohydrolase